MDWADRRARELIEMDQRNGGISVLAGYIAQGLRVERREAEKRCAEKAWQPIETAPRDGTRVDLWTERDETTNFLPGKKCRVTDCKWLPTRGTWWSANESSPRWEHGGPVRGIPTHWMPLPAPPQGEKEERA